MKHKFRCTVRTCRRCFTSSPCHNYQGFPGADISGLCCDFNFLLTYNVLQSHNNSPSCFAESSKAPKQQSRNNSPWRRHKEQRRSLISLVNQLRKQEFQGLLPKESSRIGADCQSDAQKHTVQILGTHRTVCISQHHAKLEAAPDVYVSIWIIYIIFSSEF